MSILTLVAVVLLVVVTGGIGYLTVVDWRDRRRRDDDKRTSRSATPKRR
ncbi:hypothetical protein LC612_17940 [Nostoc sp. CHAB 5834]|nr:hypothetical protein [Nostoc sp. CHAB 5834]